MPRGIFLRRPDDLLKKGPGLHPKQSGRPEWSGQLAFTEGAPTKAGETSQAHLFAHASPKTPTFVIRDDESFPNQRRAWCLQMGGGGGCGPQTPPLPFSGRASLRQSI